MSDPSVHSPRVLIVAENASAFFGGEAILPLKYFTYLAARGYDVHLITHARNAADLSRDFPELSARIHYTPDTWMHRALWRVGSRFPGTIRDHLFGNLMGFISGIQQRRMARRLIDTKGIDLVHQPIPVSPAAPSLIYGLGVPVIIGPMNGGMAYPPGYEDFEGRSAHLFVVIGRVFAGLANRLIPGKRRAALLLAANQRTLEALPVKDRHVELFSENGVDLELFPGGEREAAPANTFRLIFMGRLIPLKGLDFTLRAIANARQAFPSIHITLDILGDGPERDSLVALRDTLGLNDCVQFHGFVPQSDCAEHLRRADALILASLRECGGAVILEAMAMGLPVIASDWGGPRDYVTPKTGVLVNPAPRDSFETRLAAAITDLATNPEHGRDMGACGAKRVRQEFDWDHKIDRMIAYYAQTLAEGRS